MKYKIRRASHCCAAIVATMLSLVADGYSQEKVRELERLQQTEVRSESASQQQIEKLDNQTRELVSEYNQLIGEVEQLKNVLPELRLRVERARNSKNRYETEVAELAGAEVQLLKIVGRMRSDLQALAESPVEFVDPLGGGDFKQLSLVEELGLLLKQAQSLYESTGTIQLREDEQIIEGEKVVVDRIDVGRLVTYFVTKDRKRGFVLTGAETDKKDLDANGLALVQALLSPQGAQLVELPYSPQEKERHGGA